MMSYRKHGGLRRGELLDVTGIIARSSDEPSEPTPPSVIDLGDDPYGTRASWAEEFGFSNTTTS